MFFYFIVKFRILKSCVCIVSEITHLIVLMHCGTVLFMIADLQSLAFDKRQ